MAPGQEAMAGGLWEALLKEVATAAATPDATLLMLGRAGIGKRTLVQALLAHADPKAAQLDAERSSASEQGHSRAVGLDYAYLGCRDSEIVHNTSCPAACSVLILEDARHEKLLRSRLQSSTLQKCAALVCLDLKEPWTVMEDLRQWLDVLQKVTGELLAELPLEEQDALRAKVTACAEEFKQAAAAGEGGAEGGATSLVMNLGIPVIVAVTRADGASALESQKTIGWGEAIEVYIRNECLNYGAAIVYTMVQAGLKTSTNIDVLYEYLMHRLYGFAFKRAANLPSRDAVFVPSGWDSQERVQKAAENLQGGGLELSFESRVLNLEPPAGGALVPEECEDMQTFLKRAAGILQKIGGVSATGGRGVGAPVPEVGLADGAAAAGAADGSAPVGAMSARGVGGEASGIKRGSGSTAGPAATDNSSLANFFQNLLTRGQSGSGPNSAVGQAGGPAPAPRASAVATPAAVGAPPAAEEQPAAAAPAAPDAAPSAEG